jgi:hypothetical protein
MTTEIKQLYLDKLSRKPMPKNAHRFFAVPNEAEVSIDEEPAEFEAPVIEEPAVLVIDKRKSMRIDCESVWSKINGKVGTVFDKRKIKRTDERERPVPERFISQNLETTLGKRVKPSDKAAKEAIEEVSDTAIPEPAEPIETPERVELDIEEQPNLDVEMERIEDIELPEDIVPVITKARKRKTTAKGDVSAKYNEEIEKLNINETTTLNGKPLLARLPKSEKIIMRAPAYYMTNRKLYMQKLGELFKDYPKEIAAEMSTASCDSQTAENIQMFIHQRIVRDYLNLYTPYRGLLLFHGLGSGKTCTSIAIAEGMKTRRKVFVMTPASLKMNFFSELKKCGDVMYKKKQYWEFVSIKGQPQNVSILSKVLSLPVEFILKYNGAWLMDATKTTPNYTELSNEHQKILDEQLNAMIRTKYVDINYNGLNENRLNKLFETDSEGNETNPFNDSVVLIDEAHNFMSRVSNKINEVLAITKKGENDLKDPKKSKKQLPISYRLYDKLLRADNVRIVLMTGTPMINYPNELGIMFNLLRGVIRTWTFNISGNQKIVKDNIVEMFHNEGFKTYDYIDYANGKLTITRNPFGFINANKIRKGGFMPEMTTTTTIVHAITGGDDNSTNADGAPTDETPTTTVGGKRRSTKQTMKLKRMFKDIRETECDLLSKKHSRTKRRRPTPAVLSDQSEPGDVSNDEFSVGELATIPPLANNRVNTNLETEDENTLQTPRIDSELEKDILNYMNNVGDPHKGGNFELSFEQEGGDQIVNPDYQGVYLNEQGNISDEMFVSQIKRILRKNGVDVVGNESVIEYKALPETHDEFLQMFVKDGNLQVQNINLFKKRILGLTSYFRSAQEKLLPRFIPDENGNTYHIVPIPMSDHQFGTYYKIRTEEMTKEKAMQLIAKKATELYNTASSYRIFSRAACNFVFPSEIPRPKPPKKHLTEEDLDNIADANNEDMYIDENAAAPIRDKTYQTEIVSALSALSTTDNGKYVKPEMLKLLSPKFLRILENITDPNHRGLHLVYSNFRSLEGIGIFKLVLEHNGFAEFKIQRNGDIWEIKDTDPDLSKPRFVLYTGTETNDEKEIIRNVYNSQWDLVPASIASKLRENAANNHYGEVIRVIMITASGAEGINLENTRHVHIVEPYWNMVRIDQVVGRARRICSHKNLPEELRTVQVFLYISVFSELQRKNPEYKTIMNKDIGRVTGNAITTDENLYDIATLKNNINQQLLKGIKETAIDCRLYKKGNAETDLVCYGEGVSIRTNDFGIFPSIDEDNIVREDINVRTVTRKMTSVSIPRPNGPDLVFAKHKNNLYDWDAYTNLGQEILVARIEGKRVVFV